MRRRITFWVMAIALSLATGMVVSLARSNQGLVLERNQLFRVATQAHRGMYVPRVDATTLSGTSIVLGEPGRRQLLYFFTTTCPYCLASVPVWKDLVTEAARSDVQVVGVAMDSAAHVERYRSDHGLTFPIVLLDDDRIAALYRATRVPLTLLVSETGRVEHARTGELTNAAAIDSVRLALGEVSAFATERPSPTASPVPSAAAVRGVPQ